MTVKCGESLEYLKKLVLEYEAESHDLSEVPNKYVNEFGMSCLANSLMLKEPEIPEPNAEEITDSIRTTSFDTLDELVEYIQSLDNDIDKLFAIFTYAALNIQYDVESYFNGEIKGTSLEEVFQTKLAVCEGYSLFFTEMAKMVDIDPTRIEIKSYPNYAKGYSFDPLNPPKNVKSNHASVYVCIDGVPFISEPTWGAGFIDDGQQFQWNYQPNYFLIPLHKSLCDHFPCDEAKKLLPFKFSFGDFLKSCKISPFGRCIKTESNPFQNFELKNGFLQQIYSCTNPVDHVSFKISKRSDDEFEEVPTDGIASYEVVQAQIPNHADRSRLRTNFSFPDKGFYKISMYIDTEFAIEYFVNVLSKSSMAVPVTFNPFHENRFFPISPTRVLSKVRKGVALIRFAVNSQNSQIIWDITKLDNQKGFSTEGETIDRECGKYIRLYLPFDDDELYEDQLCVTFPSNGRYAVSIYLSNDEGSYTFYVNYYFDVSGAKTRTAVSPIDFLFEGRQFAPPNLFDQDMNEVLIRPNQSSFIVDKRENTIQIKTRSINDEIHLELKKDNETIAWPSGDTQDNGYRAFGFTLPEEFGEYHLKGWIDQNFFMDLTYVYTEEPLREVTANENQIIADLKSRIRAANHDGVVYDDEEASKWSHSSQSKENKAKSSKCCLLI